MAKHQTSSFRIAIYIRVSTEEQAENPEGSIKNQEERLRDFVRLKNMDGNFGSIVDVFKDAGISAKDMNRPALQRMLTKVRSREIDLVMVTDLSRLTRSTKDFGILWEFLQEQGCKFQSLRDNFDSTTAAGEMIMFTLANFAQFERKQTAERISNSFLARAKRGLYNGGSVPAGYRIDDLRPGHLVIDPEEAEIVRLIFKTFLKEQSLAQTVKFLNREGVKLPRAMRGGGSTRNGTLGIDMVHRILKQKAYLGIRTFKVKGIEDETKAAWDAIIEPTTFDRVAKLLAKNFQAKKPHTKTRFPYLLSGFTFCKACGDRLAGKSAHGKYAKIAYYEHSWATKSQAHLSAKLRKCEPHRVLAKRLEPIVWQEVKAFLTNPEMAKLLFDEAKTRSLESKKTNTAEKVKRKLLGVDSQIEALAERIGFLPKGIDPKVLFDQLAKLQAARSALDAQYQEAQLTETVHEEPVSIKDFAEFTKSLRDLLAGEADPVTCSFVIQSVVKRIDVAVDGIEIHFHVGQSHYMREFGDKQSLGSRPFFVQNEQPAEGAGTVLNFKSKKRSDPLEKYLKDKCSNTLTNGGGGGNRTPVRKSSDLGRATCLVAVFRMTSERPTTNSNLPLPQLF